MDNVSGESDRVDSKRQLTSCDRIRASYFCYSSLDETTGASMENSHVYSYPVMEKYGAFVSCHVEYNDLT